MNQSLESARNIHQILVVACAVIAVFAISLKPELNKYELALKDLRGIESSFYEVNIARVDRIKKRLLGGLPVETFDFVVDTAYKYKRISTLKSELNRTWSNLDSIHLIHASKELVKRIAVENKRIDITGLPLLPSPSSSSWTWEKDYYNDCDYTKAFGRIFSYLPVPNADSLFINLSPVWSDIQDKPFEEAKSRLIELSSIDRANNKGEVDLSGLKVAGEQMYLIGPGVLIVLLSYLLTLVIHVRSLLVIREDAVQAAAFPWMALFPHFWSQTLSIASLLVFPIIVSGLTAIRLQLPTDLTNKLLIGYFVCFTILGSTVCFQIFKTQLKVYQLKS